MPQERRGPVLCLFLGGENGMFSHIMIGSNDTARSKKFYDALFTAMGAQPGTEDARGRLAYSHNGSRFMVTKPIDAKPASHANGGTIGFVMKDAAQAERVALPDSRPGSQSSLRPLHLPSLGVTGSVVANSCFHLFVHGGGKDCLGSD